MNSDTKQEDSVNEESCEDRISSLEDDVLCHILSFLPTKYVVGTSILSKRWEHVWTSVPVLDFDDEHVWPFFPIDDSEYNNYHQVYHSCFSNFVNNVLSVHNLSRVRKFYLHCAAYCYNPAHIKAWIFASITPNVEVLDFCVRTSSNVFFDLPQTLYYTCRNLVYLKLRFFNLAVNVSSSVCFPRLKTLLLYPVEFSDENSMKKLLTGCPVLKNLYVEKAGWKNVHTLNVCSASLERLTIDIHKSYDNFHSYGGRYNLVLEAPNLKHIVLSDCTIENYKISELSYLVSASFSYIQSSSVVQFLKHVSNVKELCLSCYPKNYPQDNSYDNLPMFLNLTHLKVGISKILPHLIQRSPNLKSLVFEKVYGFEDYGLSQDYLFECLLPCLETIEIRLFEGSKTEMEIVEYYLKNAMALEMMTFTSSICLNLEILKQIQMLPRGSNSCQVAFR